MNSVRLYSVGFWCSLRSYMFYNQVFCCEQSTTDKYLSFQSAEIVSSTLTCQQRCLWTLHRQSSIFRIRAIRATWARGRRSPRKTEGERSPPGVPPKFDHCVYALFVPVPLANYRFSVCERSKFCLPRGVRISDKTAKYIDVHFYFMTG